MYTKICGLKREQDIQFVNELQPEYIGFVFAKNRKRTLDVDDALELKGLLDPEIKAVGVFVDQEMDFVVGLLDTGIIDVAQLHGNEDDDYIKELKIRTNCPVIKAFVLSKNSDFDTINNSSADLILVDSGQGSGIKLDEGLIQSIQRDYFLAGGLTVENVKEAIKNADSHLIGVDVSSGVETAGQKDYEKIKSFIRKVNEVENE